MIARPEVLLIAGPKGAGKTSFANAYCAILERPVGFLNAGEIAQEVTAESGNQLISDIAAVAGSTDRGPRLASAAL